MYFLLLYALRFLVSSRSFRLCDIPGISLRMVSSANVSQPNLNLVINLLGEPITYLSDFIPLML